jgi:hypothetical protein
LGAVRTFTIKGETPLTITCYKPAITIRCGDGPEAELTPEQFDELHDRFIEIGGLFDSDNPEVL